MGRGEQQIPQPPSRMEAGWELSPGWTPLPPTNRHRGPASQGPLHFRRMTETFWPILLHFTDEDLRPREGCDLMRVTQILGGTQGWETEWVSFLSARFLHLWRDLQLCSPEPRCVFCAAQNSRWRGPLGRLEGRPIVSGEGTSPASERHLMVCTHTHVHACSHTHTHLHTHTDGENTCGLDGSWSG